MKPMRLQLRKAMATGLFVGKKETSGRIGKKTEAEPELENESKGVREHKGKGDRKKY